MSLVTRAIGRNKRSVFFVVLFPVLLAGAGVWGLAHAVGGALLPVPTAAGPSRAQADKEVKDGCDYVISLGAKCSYEVINSGTFADGSGYFVYRVRGADPNGGTVDFLGIVTVDATGAVLEMNDGGAVPHGTPAPTG